MKECENIQSMIIEGYYSEEENERVLKHIKECLECAEFKKVFEEAALKMNIIENDAFEKIVDFDIDIDDVIDKAEEIKQRKREKTELLGFGGTAFSVIGAYAALAFVLGINFLMYSQIAVYVLLPLALLLLIRRRNMGGKKNE